MRALAIMVENVITNKLKKKQRLFCFYVTEKSVEKSVSVVDGCPPTKTTAASMGNCCKVSNTVCIDLRMDIHS